MAAYCRTPPRRPGSPVSPGAGAGCLRGTARSSRSMEQVGHQWGGGGVPQAGEAPGGLDRAQQRVVVVGGGRLEPALNADPAAIVTTWPPAAPERPPALL